MEKQATVYVKKHNFITFPNVTTAIMQTVAVALSHSRREVSRTEYGQRKHSFNFSKNPEILE
jgi:hypothetical protein